MENNLKIVSMQDKHVHDVFLIENELIDVPWSENLISELVHQNNAVAKVLELNNKVIGYYSFYKICDEADINNIAVSKDYQGKGYSKLLMEDLINECKSSSINDITLEVADSNKVAFALYSKFGFKVEGVRKNYYNNSEDAIIMWKRN